MKVHLTKQVIICLLCLRPFGSNSSLGLVKNQLDRQFLNNLLPSNTQLYVGWNKDICSQGCCPNPLVALLCGGYI